MGIDPIRDRPRRRGVGRVRQAATGTRWESIQVSSARPDSKLVINA
jgi:hypothetical protein